MAVKQPEGPPRCTCGRTAQTHDGKRWICAVCVMEHYEASRPIGDYPTWNHVYDQHTTEA
jgi:hypothetical protein